MLIEEEEAKEQWKQLKEYIENVHASIRDNQNATDEDYRKGMNLVRYKLLDVYQKLSADNPSYLFYSNNGSIMCFSVTKKGGKEVQLLANDDFAAVLKKVQNDFKSQRMKWLNKLFTWFYKTALIAFTTEWKKEYKFPVDLYKFVVRESFEFDLNTIYEMPERMTNHPDEWTFKYIDKTAFKRSRGDYPAWNEFLTRLQFPEYFMCWVGSLFDPLNRSRRILVLKGQGNDGKSIINGVIREIYGSTGLGSISNTSLSNSDFTLGTLYDKSFISYGDCNNPYVIRHELIKNLSGNDPVFINRKGEQGFEATVYAKIWINTNYNIKITATERSELSRLLLLRVTKPDIVDGDSEWPKQLRKESKAFLRDCVKLYEESKEKNKEEFPLSEEYFNSIAGYIMDAKEETIVRGCKQLPFYAKRSNGKVKVFKFFQGVFSDMKIDSFDEEKIIKHIEAHYGAKIICENGERYFVLPIKNDENTQSIIESDGNDNDIHFSDSDFVEGAA